MPSRTLRTVCSLQSTALATATFVGFSSRFSISANSRAARHRSLSFVTSLRCRHESRNDWSFAFCLIPRIASTNSLSTGFRSIFRNSLLSLALAPSQPGVDPAWHHDSTIPCHHEGINRLDKIFVGEWYGNAGDSKAERGISRYFRLTGISWERFPWNLINGFHPRRFGLWQFSDHFFTLIHQAIRRYQNGMQPPVFWKPWTGTTRITVKVTVA